MPIINMAKIMNQSQQQIKKLEDKVDRLSEMVAQLSYQIAILTAEKQSLAKEEPELEPYLTLSDLIPPSPDNGEQFYPAIDHKDILREGSEGKPTDTHLEQLLSPDTQIRRLTAQLTAAYNRIAALEEQLLARRIYH